MPETILDVGCGRGLSLAAFGVTPADSVMGVDINPERVQQANLTFPDRQYFVSRGEDLKLFTAPQFSRVICNVALPYMDIPQALAEMYRVLLPGGRITLTLHRPAFTFNELKSARSLKAALGRLYVLLNGIFFHFSGRTFAFPFTSYVESFQTKRGMRLALDACGFMEIRVSGLPRETAHRAFRNANKPM